VLGDWVLAAGAEWPRRGAWNCSSVTFSVFPAFVPDFDAALYASLMFLEVTCAVMDRLEWRTGQVRWPMPALLAYYLLMHFTATPLARSESFPGFSNWLGMVGRAGR